MKIFSELRFNSKNFEKELKDRLELIDFPGLNVSNNFYKDEIFTPLMRFTDGFIFVNECDLIKENDNLKILRNIINQIKIRKNSYSFSFNSCLFLLHKSDTSLDINVNKSKEIFENIFSVGMNEIEEFNVNKFSSKLYNLYIEFFNK